MVESVDEGERLAQPEAKRSGEGALSALARLQQQRHSRDAQSPRDGESDLSSAPDAGSDGRYPGRAPRK